MQRQNSNCRENHRKEESSNPPSGQTNWALEIAQDIGHDPTPDDIDGRIKRTECPTLFY